MVNSFRKVTVVTAKSSIDIGEMFERINPQSRKVKCSGKVKRMEESGLRKETSLFLPIFWSIQVNMTVAVNSFPQS